MIERDIIAATQMLVNKIRSLADGGVVQRFRAPGEIRLEGDKGISGFRA